jgi:hypothetical protein
MARNDPVRYVSTFRAPSEYERQLEEARRRAALAEALAQQQYEPQEGVVAPIPRAAPLVKALQGYMTARAGRKAREAEEAAEGMKEDYAQRMLGRMEGGYVYEGYDPSKPPAPIPEQTELGEVTRQSQYVRSPQEALAMASTKLGADALKDRPIMAERLAMMLKEPEKAKSLYAPIDAGAHTAESIRAFDASITPQNPQGDRSLLVRREYVDMPLEQRARLGMEAGRYTFETGQPPPTVGMPNFMVGPQTFGQTVPQVAAAPTMPPTAPPSDAMTAPLSQTRAGADRGPPAIEIATPQQRLKLKQEIPVARRAASSGLSKLDRLDNILADLEEHPGLENISGLIGQIPVDISPEARSARSKLNEFKEATSLQAVQEARESSATGGAYGNMTVQEWPRLESFFGSVLASKDPEDLRVAIQNARQQIAASKNLYLNSWRDTYGNLDIGYSPITYKPESARFRSGDQSDVRRRADAILRGEL